MLSLSSPLWLLAMSALPLVWWLHRFHELDRAHPVAALFLWPVSDAPGNRLRRSQRTDPVWLLRALTACLVVLALCGPGWSSRAPGALHIWIDDSPSMFAVERGESRMQRALLALEQELADVRFSPITVYSLAMPGESLSLETMATTTPGAQLRAWTRNPRGEPKLPAPALMDAQATHWLVSDGVSAGIAPWANQAPIARVFAAGGDTPNVGISGLSLRRAHDAGRGARLLVTVANGGGEPARRDLQIAVGERRLPPLRLRIPAGGKLQEVIGLGDAPLSSLRAAIGPADALALDDFLELPATSLRPLTAAVADSCGPHLRAALSAHPALVMSTDTGEPAGLNVSCGGDDAERPGPALRSGGAQGSVPVDGPLIWLPAAGSLRDLSLDPGWLAASPGDIKAGDAAVLLRSRDRPLVLFDAVAGVIDVGLDLAAPSLVSRPEYPLFISGLVDLLLEGAAEPGSVVSTSNPGPVSITPGQLAVNPGRPGVRVETVARDLSSVLIMAALLTLLLDPALFGRRLALRSLRLASPAESG